MLTISFHNFKEHAQQAATEAAAELASQTSMVGLAKARVEAIEEQLHSARIDFEATQHAAAKAAQSAAQAQNNAAEAAAHAAIGLHETQSGGGDDSGEAPNHNYGDFKASQQYSFAGY